ncbi:MAG: hypothetical protein U0790_08930 [Isosphaeraceae bacterium]
MRGRLFCGFLLLGCLSPPTTRAQEVGDDLASRIGLADLPAYRAAPRAGPRRIRRPGGEEGRCQGGAANEPRPVSFRDLWDHPDAWRGRRVMIRGRVVRSFRQDAFGEFPALVEAWLSTSRGDIFCVVYPPREGAPKEAPLGTEVRFAGTFLKPIQYKAVDQVRLAPLIVGDRPPAPAEVAVSGVVVKGGGNPAPGSRPGPGGQATDLWPFSSGAGRGAGGPRDARPGPRLVSREETPDAGA